MQLHFGKGYIPVVVVWLMLAAFLLAGFLPRYPASQPHPPSTPSPTPSAFQPTNTKIGLHTRLTDEPDPENIRREFRMLREMGGTWATEFFPWAYIQKDDKFRFDWEHADQVADAARDAGITLLARLDGVPTWARPANTTWRYLDKSH